ncbi:MAG TPA: mannonate dehydratase [Bauldia sp.]|nr:mannonate dehydratase [Bauldia sp.]
MLETWRWFGPRDPISLRQIAEAGATGIVTALHHVPPGTAWTDAEIAERKALIEAEGLRWEVVESIPTTNAVKSRTGGWSADIEAWKQSLRALGRAGVRTVCYNFMPIVDWTRTDLAYPMRSGLALRFDIVDFVAFDAFVLRRAGATGDYSADVVKAASKRAMDMSEARKAELERVVLAGLPGSTLGYDRSAFHGSLADFSGLSADDLRANLIDFLRAVLPVAEEAGIRLAIHPDDPPIPLFGMPRVVSTAQDIGALLSAVPSASNGLTFCVGSLGSRADNDVVAMLREFAARVNFLHLRNVSKDEAGSFVEAEHLGGDTDMVAVVEGVVTEERRRRDAGRDDAAIPMRPDHGHLLSADPTRNANPGYSYIGRLKGLAELRGVARALERN